MKYDELDAAICEYIASGYKDSPVSVWELKDLCNPFLSTNRTPFPSAARLIDRRLQAMRKAGRIVYADRKWSVVV